MDSTQSTGREDLQKNLDWLNGFKLLAPDRYPVEIGRRLRAVIDQGGGYDFEEVRRDCNMKFQKIHFYEV